MKKLLLFALIAFNLTYQLAAKELAAKEQIRNVVFVGDSISDVNYYNTSTFLPFEKKATCSGYTGEKDTSFAGVVCDFLGIRYGANNKSVPLALRDVPAEDGRCSSGTLDGNIFSCAAATCTEGLPVAIGTFLPQYLDEYAQSVERQITSFVAQSRAQSTGTEEFSFNGTPTRQTLFINASTYFQDAYILAKAWDEGLSEFQVNDLISANFNGMISAQADLENIGVSPENNLVVLFPMDLIRYAPIFKSDQQLLKLALEVMDRINNRIKESATRQGLRIVEISSAFVQLLGALKTDDNGLPIELSGNGPMTFSVGYESLGFVADEAIQYQAFIDETKPGFLVKYALGEEFLLDLQKGFKVD